MSLRVGDLAMLNDEGKAYYVKQSMYPNDHRYLAATEAYEVVRISGDIGIELDVPSGIERMFHVRMVEKVPDVPQEDIDAAIESIKKAIR